MSQSADLLSDASQSDMEDDILSDDDSEIEINYSEPSVKPINVETGDINFATLGKPGIAPYKMAPNPSLTTIVGANLVDEKQSETLILEQIRTRTAEEIVLEIEKLTLSPFTTPLPPSVVLSQGGNFIYGTQNTLILSKYLSTGTRRKSSSCRKN